MSVPFGIIRTISRTGEYGKSMASPMADPLFWKYAVTSEGASPPRKMIARHNTVAKSVENRTRLNGGASRNSTRLGELELYSTMVNKALKIATKAMIWVLSPLALGSSAYGMTINITTKMALTTAPGNRDSTAIFLFCALEHSTKPILHSSTHFSFLLRQSCANTVQPINSVMPERASYH